MFVDCRFCKQKYPQGQEYGSHLNNEHPYSCFYCDNFYLHRASRNQHFQEEHKKHICTICCAAFRDGIGLKYHYANITSVRYVCTICSEQLESSEALWTHGYVQHGYHCPLFGPRCVKFNGRWEYVQHMEFYHHILPNVVIAGAAEYVKQVRYNEIPCRMIEEVVPTEDKASAHRCTICQKVFLTHLMLKQHSLDDHVIENSDDGNVNHHEFVSTEDDQDEHSKLHHIHCLAPECCESFVTEEAMENHYDEQHVFNIVISNQSEIGDALTDSDREVQFATKEVQLHKIQCVVPRCSKTFVSDQDLDNHIRQCHQCVECNIIFFEKKYRDEYFQMGLCNECIARNKRIEFMSHTQEDYPSSIDSIRAK